MEPKLACLQERLDMDNVSLSKLVKRFPQVLGYNIENKTEPTLTWLQARLKLDDKSLSFVIQSMPSLLGCNIDTNLEPTITFYDDCVGSNAARLMILKCPALSTYSLENRLKPRLAEAEVAGIPIDTGALSRIAGMTEEKWCISMALQEDKLLKAQLRENDVAVLENK
jgi:hypothetical protein